MKTCFFLPSSQSHLAGCWSSAVSRLPQTEQSSAGPSHASQNELTADRFSKNTNSNTRQSSVSLLLSLVYQSWAMTNRGLHPAQRKRHFGFRTQVFCQLRSKQQRRGAMAKLVATNKVSLSKNTDVVTEGLVTVSQLFKHVPKHPSRSAKTHSCPCKYIDYKIKR